MGFLTDPFAEPYALRALLELGLLSVLAGVLGTWIVLRRLAFFAHAAGTATFPGLVVAGPWGIAPQVGALGAALAFAGALAALVRRPRVDAGAATGVLLVGALALGALLASDVHASGAGVDTLLLGSLVSVGTRDVLLTAAAVAVVLALDAVLRRGWSATTFDPDAAGALGARSRASELALPAAIALAAVVAVDAVGALLAGVVLVVPAATVRLMTDDLGALRVGACVLAAAEGSAALWLAGRLDVGPGPALALIGGTVFAAVSWIAATRRPAVTA
jgi:ABC-type Mn2+/Zn2+ transport system permease subunit